MNLEEIKEDLKESSENEAVYFLMQKEKSEPLMPLTLEDDLSQPPLYILKAGDDSSLVFYR